MSINRVVLTGNLTRDVELRRTQSGMAIMSFGIAVNDRRKNNETGEWEDYANFIDCTMFGTRAEAVANYISKGSKVGIEGKLRYSTWERDGQKRSKLEVIVDELEFLSPRQEANHGYQGGAQGAYQPQAGGYNGYAQNAPQTAPQPPQGGFQGGYAPQGYGQQQPPMQPAPQPNTSVYDDDIPF